MRARGGFGRCPAFAPAIGKGGVEERGLSGPEKAGKRYGGQAGVAIFAHHEASKLWLLQTTAMHLCDIVTSRKGITDQWLATQRPETDECTDLA